MLHARFPRLERDEAVREAKELESTLGVRVKVIRETYNTDNNNFDEADVYISGHTVAKPKKGSIAAGAGGGGGGGGGTGGGKASGGKGRGGKAVAARRTVSHGGSGIGAAAVILRLTVILLVAAGLGLGALRVLPAIVTFLYDFGFRVTADEYGQLLFVVFTLVFLMTGVPLGLRFIPRNANLAIRKPQFAMNARPVPAAKAQVDAKLKKSLNKLASQAASEQIPDKWADDEPEEPYTFGADEEVLPEILPGPDEEPPPLTPPPAEAEPAKKPKGKGGAAQESDKDVSARFLDHAIETVRKVSPQLDKYNRFALNLYMAGAVQGLAAIRGLDHDAQRALLKAALMKLGTPADIAGEFHDKVGEYTGEERYKKVIQTGRSGMESWVSGDEGTPQYALQALIKDWNRPATEKKPSIMTVMFTDMVGSTDLTQARGDLAAQEVVRKHNAIVRTALTQFAGREVKHTGDGIMASFASAANAVDATVQIQRQVAIHNEKQPNLPLHLRIGLNSGEPIQEEDDLFGSTVQLSARVCAATQSDQTLCTQVVKDLSGTKGLAFVDAGMHSLKGFRDKIQLWEVKY
ncbi:adenylate/guanylate cyclase domain-containing protein [Magnetospirillum sp. SS-4]|uniref:adenylate/guanylate cyclase domain-containing protein n=1 Tax=Magnetospirillum sp. SS-4 TaxID=2681465 RepID=UPI0020C2659A|nr:adenylate/guanylate cyclase domain-containing protein [Magnetospirillum sp. SS-4]